MRKFSSYITGLASLSFMFVSAMNDRLVYSAAMYYAHPDKVEQKVRDNHTDDTNGTFHESAYTANMIQLDRFYRLVD